MISVNRKLKKSNKLIIKKDSLEWLIISILFLISFLNNMTLLIFMISILLLLKQKTIGSLKILNLLTMRTIINPALGVDISNYQLLKWVIIFSCSLYLFQSYKDISYNLKKDIQKLIFLILIFGIYNVLASFFFSTLPTIAISKLISYLLPFIGILIGISATANHFDWISWLHRMFVTLLLLSVPLVILPVGYLRNGRAFQGILNHPNLFGVFLTLLFSLTLVKGKIEGKFKLNDYIIIFLSFIFVILTKSRTALLSNLIIILIFLFFPLPKKINKIFLIFMLLFSSLIIIVFTGGEVVEPFIDFLYKGQESILYSRLGQVSTLMNNFLRSPWFGSGFAVPVTPFRTFSFSAEAVVEPGNLIIAVLSYSGIIGFILFGIYMFKIFYRNKNISKSLIYIYISPIIISMGEMVFFSTNNIGIWCYCLLAMYYAYDRR